MNEGPLIVKPALSATGVGLEVLDSKENVTAYSKRFSDLLKLENYIVQPLIESIKTEGEWSLIFIAGAYSHSIHKAPKKGDVMVHAERGGSLNFKQAPLDLVEEASKAIPSILKAFESQSNKANYVPLYLRCDFIKDSTQDKYLLSESEGVEPELFFRAKPSSEETFVEALENYFSGSIFE